MYIKTCSHGYIESKLIDSVYLEIGMSGVKLQSMVNPSLGLPIISSNKFYNVVLAFANGFTPIVLRYDKDNAEVNGYDAWADANKIITDIVAKLNEVNHNYIGKELDFNNL